MTELRQIASGLMFPEGPVAMPDGSVLLVEIRRGTLSRVTAHGRVEVVADLGGGPNGAAIGPDGRCYVCNNGGFEWHDYGGVFVPGEQAADYSGGRIEAVDLATGKKLAAHPGHNTASLTFSKSGKRLQALDGLSSALRVWDWNDSGRLGQPVTLVKSAGMSAVELESHD